VVIWQSITVSYRYLRFGEFLESCGKERSVKNQWFGKNQSELKSNQRAWHKCAPAIAAEYSLFSQAIHSQASHEFS
jgi:hypothetical protein